PFCGRFGPQFCELAFPFLRMARLGLSQLLQHIAPRFIALVLGKVTIGAHALHFALPVLLQGGDKLSPGLPGDRSTIGCSAALWRLSFAVLLFFFSTGTHVLLLLIMDD